MNRALPPGDRRDRSGDSGGPSRSAAVMSRAFGLAGGVADPPEGKTPPGGSPAALYGGKGLS